MTPPPRTPQQRKRDALERLERDVDAWVATADNASGSPYLVPLSFLWDGTSLLLATARATRTARNLLATGKVRIGVGQVRDLVLIDGTVDALATAELPDDVGDAFALKAGFDPRRLTGYLYFRVRPRRLQVWRNEDELEGRDLIRDGRWVVTD
jgi:Pyridoxamine 5'-phosphate oxidase